MGASGMMGAFFRCRRCVGRDLRAGVRRVVVVCRRGALRLRCRGRRVLDRVLIFFLCSPASFQACWNTSLFVAPGDYSM